MTAPIRQFLFMGEQLETLDRGRVYSAETCRDDDGSLARWAAERAAKFAHLPLHLPLHGTHLNGPCVCGRALWDDRCAAARKEQP